MKKFLFWMLTVILAAIQPSVAQIVGNANDFLEIGGFAASQSLGNADGAYATGAESGHCNPAGMSMDGGKWDFSFLHNRYMGGLATQNMLAAACQTDSLTTLGATLVRVGVDDIQNTLHLFDSDGKINYDNISYFSVADYALYFSFGRRMRRLPALSVGANVKLIYRHEGDFANAYGFGIDLAARYSWRRLSCAAVLRDATTTFDFWSVNESKFDSAYLATGNTVPESRLEQRSPSLVLSAAYRMQRGDFGVAAMAALRSYFGYNTQYVVHSDFASVDPALGLELSYKDIVKVRGGVSDFQHDNNLTISHHTSARPSVGAGLRLYGFRIDYAFFFSGAMGEGSNVVTVGYGF
ncbi:MAG: hypothetical protein II852_18785 [Bacteroidales bacterium]|nr:hypothetical protein [Bacteroidales bacterium]